ncbi:BSD domain-containing protein 1-like [Panicum miliaceum]|uniref:BSD domain-containing protein 1-like n=1 Tax=Panicum miliaceum TaxID=4540 RepID=A0A3L6QSV6_PANMI|nr:BSD domain-containing protein 1-like [Panicum miliaceum]
MDFFKSILAEPDPDPASPPPEQDPESAPAGSASSAPAAPAPAPAGGGSGGWGIGGLLKTLTSQSETVLETYRRDLAEFGTGLRRETEVLREAAARAARDLPSSAHALDGLADIVAQGKDALSQVAAAAAAPVSAPSDGGESEQSSAAGAHVRYSRFEAQLRALQADPATFTADPEDAEDFAAWSKGFSLDERKDDIEALCYDGDALEAMVDRLVPETVESEVFWARYFYRVHKLKQQEDARAKLVQRVIAQEEDEDLSWEVDDEDEEEEQQKEAAKEPVARQQEAAKEVKHEVEAKENERVLEEPATLEGEHKNADEPQPVVVDEEEKEGHSKSNVEESGDKKEAAKHETSDSSKDSDYSIVSRQRTMEEEDLEWDEIEDLGEHEEKKGSTHDPSPALKEELRKRLSVAEDDEDLSWDIEDDDDKS